MGRSDRSTRRVSGAPSLDSTDTGMATVSFSVPGGVKDAFDEAFTCRDKSAVIADLMREAVERVRRRQWSRTAVGRILERRRGRPARSNEMIRSARHDSTSRP